MILCKTSVEFHSGLQGFFLVTKYKLKDLKFPILLFLVFLTLGCTPSNSADQSEQNEFCNRVVTSETLLSDTTNWTLKAQLIGQSWVSLEDEILRTATRDLLLSVEGNDLTQSSVLFNAVKIRCWALQGH